ncbi:AAA family ATPase [Xanthobacter sp. V4C-4]|uniref:AAA family ATPase n=1 Tax=Xanthobacter cornucopiae TaxID=3119924 RepID=UPI0037295BA6
MRFLSLGLDRYGRFTDRRLDFDPQARVVVVLGANEAGKSTALQAACDALFGIDERSRFNFLHDYKSMRLSATLAAADGRTLSFARLKRRQATLVTPEDETPLPDDVLAPFLGAHDRTAFRAIFGLDQPRLREGGAKLLAGGGDLAETLIAAAPGLSRVAALRDRMKASAAEVFNPDRRNAKAAFYAATDRYADAHRRLKDTELRGDEVKAARAAAERAARARADAEATETDAAGAARRAQSLLRAAKELRLIAQCEADRAALGPLPEVEARFPDTARERLAAHARAAEAAARATLAETQARHLRAAISVDDAILAVADEVTRSDEERAQVEKELVSLPNRQREADAARAGLQRIAAGLGLADVEALRARLPSPPLLKRAEALADRRRDHAARLQALEEDAEALARRRREVEARAQGHPPVTDPAPLQRQVEALDGAETRAAAAATLAHRLATAAEARAARVARLPFGPWRAEDLASRPLPDRTAADAALARLAGASDSAARAREQREALAEQEAQLQARRAVLDAAGTAPTAQAIAASREARDELWRQLRPVLLAQRPPLPTDGAQAEAFERALAAADRLADERLSESQRLADLARTALDLADLAARHAAAATRHAAAEAARDTALDHWRHLWRASGLAPTPDAGAIALLREVEALRQETEVLAAQQAEAAQLAEAVRWDRARAEALRADLALPPLGDAPIRMAELRAAVAGRAEAFQRQRDQTRDRARLDADAASLGVRRDALDAQATGFATEIEQVFPALAIRPEATPGEARAALTLWHEAATLHEQLTTAERRIAGIEQDEQRFAAGVERLLRRLQDTARGTPAQNTTRDPTRGALQVAAADGLPATVRALRARLDSARQAHARADAADAALAERAATAAAAAAALERSQAALAEVLTRAGVDDPAHLPQRLDRLEQAAQGATLLAAARARLDDLRGAQAVEDIRAAIAGRDDEALARHADETATAHVAARAARDGAIERDTEARREQEALTRRTGAATAAQEAQDAIADIDAAMARFTRDHVGARLLSFAIERYREAHQSPIVTRAAGAFATLTGGRWSGIAIDYDQDPPRLAAARDGRLHGVDALSEGTADQLFLALRVAAIEEHARRATPLPFFADDLFVSFDEARTETGLRLLAELGAVTQVIVFTHHVHVAECATRALGPEAAVITL